uniref:Uncharacterized protein n=1 Tax=Anguilla anguilla TaxID=7936 RepID=A0A0E9QKX8_ANGAN
MRVFNSLFKKQLILLIGAIASRASFPCGRVSLKASGHDIN